MKPIAQSWTVAVLAIGVVNSQTTTVINDPSDTLVTTVYYSICPTATTTTISMSSTLTICPGPNCNGGDPWITGAPDAGHQWWHKPHGSEIIDYTTTGADGKVSVYREYLTVYDQICSTGGLEPATYTITEECPCHSSVNPTSVPSGFTTTVVACDACGRNGQATTITLTTPCATGPYASATPIVGSGSTTGSAAGATAGMTGAQSTQGMAPVSTQSASSGALNTGAAQNSGAGAGDAGNGQIQSGNPGISTTAGSMANGNNTAAAPPNTPTLGGSQLTSPYTSSADRTAMGLYAVLAGVIGYGAWAL